jgi:hypothetical protein
MRPLGVDRAPPLTMFNKVLLDEPDGAPIPEPKPIFDMRLEGRSWPMPRLNGGKSSAEPD